MIKEILIFLLKLYGIASMLFTAWILLVIALGKHKEKEIEKDD